jgi:hypothetical protein
MYKLRLTLLAFVLASFALVLGGTALAASSYHLFGDAQIVSGGNPGSAAQLRSSATPPGYGGVDFDVPAGMTVGQLNYLATDYKFTAGSCGGGAPRFQLNADNGTNSGNIFVYIGPPPGYTGCPAGVWTPTGDLLQSALFVDTSQLPGGTFYDLWELALVKYGSYALTGIQLVTDAGWMFGTQTVLVDNVQINEDTYTFESKDSCKNGGWRDFTSSPGPFKNQGECVSSFARG